MFVASEAYDVWKVFQAPQARKKIKRPENNDFDTKNM
jgi:hypothetical protein